MSAVNWILSGVALALLALLYFSRRRTASAASRVADASRPVRRPMPSASVNRQMNWLQGTGGAAQGRAYHVGSRALTIGRQVGNYIQVVDDEVSRVHARLLGTTGGVQVTDESQSGTFVNGERLVGGDHRDVARRR